MKKSFLVLLLVLCLIFCGCGKKETDVSTDIDKEMIGKYELTNAQVAGKKYTKKDQKFAKRAYRLVILGKGKAELYIKDSKHYVSYNSKYIISTDKNGELEKTRYEFKNKKIIMYYKGGIYTYNKKQN